MADVLLDIDMKMTEHRGKKIMLGEDFNIKMMTGAARLDRRVATILHLTAKRDLSPFKQRFDAYISERATVFLTRPYLHKRRPG